MSGWLSLPRLLMLKPTLSCPHNVNEGVTNEPISKAITYDLALSVPPGLGAQVPVSDTDGPGWNRSSEVHKDVRRAAQVGGRRAECTK